MVRRRPGKGQLGLPFEAPRKALKMPGKPKPGKGPSPEEKRALKATADRLGRLVYAALCSQPKSFHGRDVAFHKREIGQYIGRFKKGKLTYQEAQALLGMAKALLEEARIKYNP